MNFRVRSVIELLQHVSVGIVRENFFRFHDCAGHSARTGRQNNFRAEGHQDDTTLETHGVRHDEDEFVASHRSYKRKADARVAACRLDQHGLAWMNQSRTFGFDDHADANAVFDAGQWILALEFGHDFGNAALGHFIQANQRSVAN